MPWSPTKPAPRDRGGPRRPIALACLAFALVCLCWSAGAGAEPLDRSFGKEGLVISARPIESEALALARDHQGRLVAAGTTSTEAFATARYSAGGSPDPTFGRAHGVAKTGFSVLAEAHDIAIDRRGRTVVAGAAGYSRGRDSFSSFALARYGRTGRLDRSFGRRGRVRTPLGMNGGGAFAVALGPSGEILAGGYRENGHGDSQGLLVRYRADGSIDRSFGAAGEVTIGDGRGQARIGDLAVLRDGSILVAGGIDGRLLLERLHRDGRPDLSFGQGAGRTLLAVSGPGGCRGPARCPFANSISIRRGAIVLGGNIERQGATVVARFNRAGLPVRTFGAGGVARLKRGFALDGEQTAIGPTGDIWVAGHVYRPSAAASEVAVSRLLPDGARDRSFGDDGIFTRAIGKDSGLYAATVEPDGDLVAAGYANPEPIAGEPEAVFPLEGDRFLLLRLRG